MFKLSPAAEAVAKAALYVSSFDPEAYPNQAQEIAAAALRAAADQVVPDDLELSKRSGEAVRLNRLSICRQIRAIADELEAQ